MDNDNSFKGVYQETLVILKPDALERNKVGSIIKYYEDIGLKILDLKFYKKIDVEHLFSFYNIQTG